MVTNVFFHPIRCGDPGLMPCCICPCVQDIGGYDMQKQEIREAVELPLVQADLYKQIGIDPPRGVLLYGPPGTGKTMLAKAVAHHTTAAFIRVVGSEFVQKYLGEVGPLLLHPVRQQGAQVA
jgi:26S proteasome regulatory subunit T3